MSTNSLVAYMDKDWKVTTSYVHYDGYATGVGEMLLENYNSDERARKLATTLGYASALSETVEKSQSGRANSDVPEVYENYLEFEEYIMKNSGLEYVYVWNESEHKWQVASWTHTKKKFNNGICNDFEFVSDWNGFEDLVEVFVREGYETVKRYRKLAAEEEPNGGSPNDYTSYADELDVSVKKWTDFYITG